MSSFKQLLLAPKALCQLGAKPVFWYLSYQIKLCSGILRIQTPKGGRNQPGRFELKEIVSPVTAEQLQKTIGDKTSKLFAEAEEILEGKVRLFGGEPINIEAPESLKHWTFYANRLPDGSDIKPVWEMGRFGFGTVLARAYWLSKEEHYAEGFWNLTKQFLEANPVNLGPQWASAQEVALRLIALAFSYSLLADAKASTPERKVLLARSLAAHVERIPPTLDYARAQNNNHLLSEAAGLYTAGVLLPAHPRAKGWQQTGRNIFLNALEQQIHDDGSYVQHSANYHRLMLQLGIWFLVVTDSAGEPVPKAGLEKLTTATRWLRKLLDEESGQTPNLGPNDGAYILPLTILPFEDYRPVLQAANLAFEKRTSLEAGPWDEMAQWLGLETAKPRSEQKLSQPIRLEGKDSWAYFRVAEFKERPGHADQLHVDLWWRGLNIAQDAGSYLYTAPDPWNNALASTRFHNTVMLDNREQMTRAGRFLWVDWAQGKILSTQRSEDGRLIEASAEHNGYQKLGVVLRREIRIKAADRWTVSDHILPLGKKPKNMRGQLNWLLSDWPWLFNNQTVHLASAYGMIQLSVETSVGDQAEFQITRAGELLYGKGPADPILGWRSPTYGIKVPALSFVIDFNGPLPITLVSTWTFPG